MSCFLKPVYSENDQCFGWTSILWLNLLYYYPLAKMQLNTNGYCFYGHISCLSIYSFKLKALKISADVLWLLTSTKNLLETIAISFLRVSSCKKMQINIYVNLGHWAVFSETWTIPNKFCQCNLLAEGPWKSHQISLGIALVYL